MIRFSLKLTAADLHVGGAEAGGKSGVMGGTGEM